MTRPNARGGIASGLERWCFGVHGHPRGALVPAQVTDTAEPDAHHTVRVGRFAFGSPTNYRFDSESWPCSAEMSNFLP